MPLKIAKNTKTRILFAFFVFLCGQIIPMAEPAKALTPMRQIDSIGPLAGLMERKTSVEKSRVALVSCETYDEAAVYAAVKQEPHLAQAGD